ncbi:MAG: hypothetical protein K0S39_1510 [Paenibacillus sp.]|nr:hypothetical protein [Paenibacillus sp.]
MSVDKNKMPTLYQREASCSSGSVTSDHASRLQSDKSLPLRFRELGDDELVGFPKHRYNDVVRHRAVKDDGIPVLLVHVVSGNDKPRIALALQPSFIWRCFQVDALHALLLAEQSEHFVADIQDRHMRVEWIPQAGAVVAES